VVLGLWFLFDGIRFSRPGTEWTAGVSGFLNSSLDNDKVWGFYKGFIETFLLPNVDIVASFVLIAFLLVGAGLILGILTRGFALFGLLLNLNFVMARGFGLLGPHIDAWFIIAELALMFSAAGWTFGFDRWLARKWPGGRLFTGVS
jgi:hypothetical protein